MSDGIVFAGQRWNRWEYAVMLYASYLLRIDPHPTAESRRIACALLDVTRIVNEAELRRTLRDVAGVRAEDIVEPIRLAMAAM